jgi:NifU-like protein involved in Fe-S cluster formation
MPESPALQPLATSITACGCERPRRTVTDFVLNQCRREARQLATPAGEICRALDGAEVQFAVALDAGNVADVRYRASSCATLIAYAELLGDLVVGAPVAEAMRLSPDRLAEALPGVPGQRQDRAALVVRAWWSALARAIEAQPREEPAR